jgi:acetylornithine deacetylase/succinyl-diaminopimelate desuccinylase-like protein
MCHIAAVQAWLETSGDLPLNVKFILEGEEECNGQSLADSIQTDKSRLACDYAVISDGSQLRQGTPAITYGLRGLVYMEVIVKGPAQDLHSGQYGGAVANPANVLARLIAGLHDGDGRVTLEDFYDSVVPIDSQQRQALAELGCQDDQLKAHLGVTALPGESGYTSRERMWARPTLDVNGLVSGYIEPGAKTIIPAQASAKISMRLVSQQNPQAIIRSFKKYFTQGAGPGVSVDFIEHGQGKPVLVDKASPGVQAAMRALEKGFSAPAAFVRSGGTIPVVALLAEQLTPNILLMGFGLPDDNAHGPNENFRLDDYYHGQLAAAHLLAELAAVRS